MTFQDPLPEHRNPPPGLNFCYPNVPPQNRAFQNTRPQNVAPQNIALQYPAHQYQHLPSHQLPPQYPHLPLPANALPPPRPSLQNNTPVTTTTTTTTTTNNATVASTTTPTNTNPTTTTTTPATASPAHTPNYGNRYTLAQKLQCLTLLAEGFPGLDIERKTGVKQSAQSHIKKKAFDRGFRPKEDPRILELYVRDGERSGRPKKKDKVKKGKEEPDDEESGEAKKIDGKEMGSEAPGAAQGDRPDANMMG